MKTYQIYECDHCGFKSRDFDEVFACEANHLGLTSKEYEKYRALKSGAAYFNNLFNDPDTVEAFSYEKLTKLKEVADEYLKQVKDFEKEHNIQ